MAADRHQTPATCPSQFQLLLPPPPACRNGLLSSPFSARFLSAAFWCCFLTASLAVVWTIQNTIESGRTTLRVRKAQDDSERLEADATMHLAQAESELIASLNAARDLGEIEIRNSPARDLNSILETGLRASERLAPQIGAARARVQAAR